MEAAATYVAPWRRNTSLFLLMVLTMIGHIDRQIVNVLLEPIKADLQVSDTDMGLLSGLYFVLFYLIAGIPLARLADRGSRRAIIAACVAVWSVATTLSGAARSYAHLAICRAFVAAGEAGVQPAGGSLVSEIFPLRYRTRAFSVIFSGSALGGGLGILIGGTLSDVYGWRTVFVLVGIPGLVLAPIALWLLPEPRRDAAREPEDAGASLWQTLVTLSKIPTFWWLATLATLGATVGFSIHAWGPAFLSRVHGMSHSEMGIKLGLITIVGLFAGNISSGFVADWLGMKDPRWRIWVSGFALLGCIPTVLAAAFVESANVSVLCIGLFSYFLAFWPPAVIAAVVGIADVRSRAMASACLYMFFSLGGAIGPFVLGFMNDRLNSQFGAEAIRYSLASVSIGCLLAALVALTMGNQLRRDYRPS